MTCSVKEINSAAERDRRVRGGLPGETAWSRAWHAELRAEPGLGPSRSTRACPGREEAGGLTRRCAAAGAGRPGPGCDSQCEGKPLVGQLKQGCDPVRITVAPASLLPCSRLSPLLPPYSFSYCTSVTASPSPGGPGFQMCEGSKTSVAGHLWHARVCPEKLCCRISGSGLRMFFFVGDAGEAARGETGLKKGHLFLSRGLRNVRTG